MDNKVKVPGGAFYAGDGLTVDPVTRTVSGSGGGGFEYDFIIRMDELENLTLEKGTYASIIEKLGTQPVNGRVLANIDGGTIKDDINSIIVEYINNKLSVYTPALTDETIAKQEIVINPDNTVTWGV